MARDAGGLFSPDPVVPGMANAPSAPRSDGLTSLRRSGAVTELLFLYECTTREPAQLRPIADHLGLTVQAVSHSFRQLAKRGLVEMRDGRYRPTVSGVAWLHGALSRLREDVGERLDRLYVIRTTRALAATELRAGQPVSLELKDGTLVAQPGGSGASHGRVARAARRGDLVEVVDLEGILPLKRAPVRILTVAAVAIGDAATVALLRRAIGPPTTDLLAAPGLEAQHLASAAVHRPLLRFGVAAACAEASQLGVSATVVLLEEELPRFLSSFAGPDPPPISVVRIGRSPGTGSSARKTSRR